MATRFNGDGAEMARSTTLPSITAFTLMGWVKRSVDTGVYSAFMSFEGAAGVYYFMGVTDADVFGLFNGADLPGGTALTVGTWYHVAMTVAGTGRQPVPGLPERGARHHHQRQRGDHGVAHRLRPEPRWQLPQRLSRCAQGVRRGAHGDRDRAGDAVLPAGADGEPATAGSRRCRRRIGSWTTAASAATCRWERKEPSPWRTARRSRGVAPRGDAGSA